jgi:AraC-like DNA-binding protein
LHGLPATIGIAAWKTGLLPSMDVYVIACWMGYLAVAIARFWSGYAGYAPEQLRRFIVLFMLVLGAIVGLRVVMSIQAAGGMSFRDSPAYLLVLGAVLLLTFQLLFTSLHYPGLLTAPGAYVKYAHAGTPAAAPGDLEQRFSRLMQDGKPYLNPDITLGELAVMLDVPARQVSQLINAQFAMNVPAYLNQCRVREAARILLETPDKPIKVVMFEAGFTSKTIFNREFQRNMGVNPSAFRRGERPN